jgi:hypothetical protein
MICAECGKPSLQLSGAELRAEPQVPESCDSTSPNAIEASNTTRILASCKLMHGLHGTSEKDLTAQETIDILRLVKFLAASIPVGSTNAKNDGCGRLVAGIDFLRLPASRTSALGT